MRQRPLPSLPVRRGQAAHHVALLAGVKRRARLLTGDDGRGLPPFDPLHAPLHRQPAQCPVSARPDQVVSVVVREDRKRHRLNLSPAPRRQVAALTLRLPRDRRGDMRAGYRQRVERLGPPALDQLP
jgi:hypothetical protein